MNKYKKTITLISVLLGYIALVIAGGLFIITKLGAYLNNL